MEDLKTKTYDVIFNDETCSNEKGWHQTKNYCVEYVKSTNGTNESYFANYKGGVASVVCNETGEVVYEEIIY